MMRRLYTGGARSGGFLKMAPFGGIKPARDPTPNPVSTRAFPEPTPGLEPGTPSSSAGRLLGARPPGVAKCDDRSGAVLLGNGLGRRPRADRHVHGLAD